MNLIDRESLSIRENWVEITGALFSIFVVVDIVLLNSNILIGPALSSVSGNENAARVIVSVLLLFAYLLQYRTQSQQRKIMERQEELMEGEYFPVVQFHQLEGENEIKIDGNTISGGFITLMLSNSGNSIAKDLRLKFHPKLSGSSDEIELSENTMPLKKKEESTRATITDGGVIPTGVEQEEYRCHVEVGYEEDTITFEGLWHYIEELDEDDSELEIRFEILFENAVGETGSLAIGGRRKEVSSISDFEDFIDQGQRV